MGKIFKIVIINVLLIAAGLLAVELVFGGWLRDDPFRKLFVPTNIDREYRLDGLYPGPELIRYTRDGHGLRGSYPSPEKIDILTVGGSTTDQAYIDDSATWQQRMAEALKGRGIDVNVVNGGIDGQSTYGHLKSFEWWFPRIPGFKPKCILYYVGINDMFAERPVYEQHGLRGLIVEKSVLYRALRILKGALLAKQYDIGHGRTDFAAIDWTDVPLAGPETYRAAFGDLLDGYAERLRQLVRETRAIGAEPVFVTQQTRFSRMSEGRLEGSPARFGFRGHEFNGVDRHHVMEMFNDAVRQVCLETGTPCIDLAQGVAFNDADFYDFMHNTPSGAEKIGRFLAGGVADNPVLLKRIEQ